VLHKCDVRNCVNPKHLFLGTNKDNVDDKVIKDRQVYNIGERHGMHILSDSQVEIIRQRYAAGDIFQRELAAEYGVS